MFFFIGGVQPKTVVLDPQRRLCPACGLAQARLQRVDQYLSLFFIPLLPIRRGEPMLLCDRCGHGVALGDGVTGGAGAAGPAQRPQADTLRRCHNCGAALEPRFKYCPQCGCAL